MITSENTDRLYEALSLFQGEVNDPSRTKANEFLGYKYATLSDLLQAARPLLSKNGLALMQAVSRGEHADAVCITRLVHRSGQYVEETLSLPVEPKKGLSNAQCFGVASTYARRYGAGGILGLASDNDTDGQAEEDPVPVTLIDGTQVEELKALCEQAGITAEALGKSVRIDALEQLAANRLSGAKRYLDGLIKAKAKALEEKEPVTEAPAEPEAPAKKGAAK